MEARRGGEGRSEARRVLHNVFPGDSEGERERDREREGERERESSGTWPLIPVCQQNAVLLWEPLSTLVQPTYTRLE